MEPSTADLVPKMTGFRLKSGHFGAEDLEARSPGGGQPTGILRILTTRPPGWVPSCGHVEAPGGLTLSLRVWVWTPVDARMGGQDRHLSGLRTRNPVIPGVGSPDG